jgi:hypothetical protein
VDLLRHRLLPVVLSRTVLPGGAHAGGPGVSSSLRMLLT